MILFLDFDGVLHPKGTEVDGLFGKAPLLWSLLSLMPRLRVVFSTSWRASHSFDELVNFATYGGGEAHADRFLGSTPRLTLDPSRNITGPVHLRQQECEAWLQAHPGPYAWLALEDEDCNFAPDHPHCYRIDGRVGLSALDLAAIRDTLRQQPFTLTPAHRRLWSGRSQFPPRRTTP